MLSFGFKTSHIYTKPRPHTPLAPVEPGARERKSLRTEEEEELVPVQHWAFFDRCLAACQNVVSGCELCRGVGLVGWNTKPRASENKLR